MSSKKSGNAPKNQPKQVQALDGGSAAQSGGTKKKTAQETSGDAVDQQQRLSKYQRFKIERIPRSMLKGWGLSRPHVLKHAAVVLVEQAIKVGGSHAPMY